MKKMILCIAIIFLITGCANNNNKLTCTSNSTANGLTTNITYDIDYDENDDVKYVTITYNYKQDTATSETMDGVNVDSDGITSSTSKSANDEIIDGVVGDVIDETIGAVTNTILDIAGIKTTYDNQMSVYDNIEGFSYKVDLDTDNEYTVVYKIDMEKISDNDLTRFNIDRDITTNKTTYQSQGYTCK